MAQECDRTLCNKLGTEKYRFSKLLWQKWTMVSLSQMRGRAEHMVWYLRSHDKPEALLMNINYLIINFLLRIVTFVRNYIEAVQLRDWAYLCMCSLSYKPSLLAIPKPYQFWLISSTDTYKYLLRNRDDLNSYCRILEDKCLRRWRYKYLLGM